VFGVTGYVISNEVRDLYLYTVVPSCKGFLTTFGMTGYVISNEVRDLDLYTVARGAWDSSLPARFAKVGRSE